MANLLKSPIIKFVLIGTIISLIIWLMWRKYQNILKEQELEPLYIRKPVNAKAASSYSSDIIPLPRTGEGYTLSVWIWIDDWEYRLGEWKHILHKGDKDASSVQPGIWLHPTKNKILVRFDRKGRGQEFAFKQNKYYNSVANMDMASMRKVFYPTNIESLPFVDPITLEAKNQVETSRTDGVKESDYDRVKNEISNKYPKVNFGNYNLNSLTDWCSKTEDCQGFTAFSQSTDSDPYNNENRILMAMIPDQSDNDELVTEQNPPRNGGVILGTYIKGQNRDLMDPSKNKKIIRDETISNDVDNIPLNRWCHICVVGSNQASEVFIDGKLRKSTVLGAPLKQNDGKLWVTQDGGFSGTLTQLRYFDTALSHKRIEQIYACGPNCWQWPDLGSLAKKIANKVDINIEIKGNVGKNKL